MKVAYFCDTFAPQINGVSTTLEKLHNYAESNDIQTIFLVPNYPDASISNHNVYRFFSIPLFFYKECRIVIPPIFKAERILAGFKPDIIHAYSEFGISLAAIRYAKRHNIPIVSSYTSNFNTYLRYYNMDIISPYLENYLNWFHNSCKLTFCPSETTKEYLFNKNIKRVEIMRRGVDSSRFNPSFWNASFRKKVGADDDSVIFTYVGRVSPEKDLDILASSIHNIKSKYGNKAVFVIVGGGPSLDILKQELGEKVYFTGFLKGQSLSEAYASSDVFVFPSTSETFGNVVLEAMCSGLPAIVPNSGGVSEIVTNDFDGFVVNPKDTSAFSAAIEKFIQVPQLITAMRKNALDTAHNSTWDNVFGKLFNQYRQVIEKEIC